MIETFKKEPYTFLSNMYPCEVLYKGRVFKSSEAAYQSAKSGDENWKDWCASEDNPYLIKKKSRQVDIKEDWDEYKKKVMWNILKRKYSIEPLRSKLLETGDEFIQEGNWWGDKFWGVCLKTGEGENYLGRMLMEIRRRIKDGEL
ncbi:hypothetical protein M316_0088 [Nitrincola phage 1M3-16]|uniref:hypothetical protein n=1 Tax=Nitrincola phage 1M3-16 TaxID=1472912 RepID=UPI000444BC0F|nr:hypothetical protein GJ22_gp064 [Nitrincola phage 1M3-16]AHX01153.1 hypothetical protein M316_0088 [Nitrincola phage 1M3-16]